MSKVFYTDNGSTAVESALKMALQFWHNKGIPKKKVVCFKKSYHGDTFGAMSAAGRNEFNRPFWSHLFEVEAIDPPIEGCESASLQQLESLIKKGDIACFIFEPLVLGSGGMIIYPPSGLARLIEMCQESDVITIADEVMTGFGRTGTLFACDQLFKTPDIICLSKGVTGGFLPLGVTACTEKIYESFLGEHLSQAFLHGHSYTGNPIACASAIASLDLLCREESRCDRERIAQCHSNFCDSWKGHEKLTRCESLGTILALEYRSEGNSYFQPLSKRLYDFFLGKGVLLRPLGNVLYILPPYCITTDDLQYIYNLIATTLEGEL